MNILLTTLNIILYAYTATVVLVLPLYILLQIVFVYITDTLVIELTESAYTLKSSKRTIVSLSDIGLSQYLYIPSMVYRVHDEEINLDIYVFHYVMIISI